jgi:hypothetical protein
METRDVPGADDRHRLWDPNRLPRNGRDHGGELLVAVRRMERGIPTEDTEAVEAEGAPQPTI